MADAKVPNLHLVRLGDLGDEILRRDLTGLRTLPDEVRPLCGRVRAICRQRGGIGIAAPQLGLSMRFFYLTPKAYPPAGEFFLEPEWEPDGDRTTIEEEGCLSIKDRYQVERYHAIWLTYSDLGGSVCRVRRIGWTARAIQHECDHLRGRLISDHGISNN